jgi:replication fork protection complex subunit Tof1/Swi1
MASPRPMSVDASDDGPLDSVSSKRERARAALLPPITNLCSALGGFEEVEDEQGEITRVYRVGDECLGKHDLELACNRLPEAVLSSGCLKDLKRFWRMDDADDDRTVARIFYETGVLPNDIVPILQTSVGTSSKGDKIALACGQSAASLLHAGPC